jgi:hypothetical protein
MRFVKDTGRVRAAAIALLFEISFCASVLGTPVRAAREASILNWEGDLRKTLRYPIHTKHLLNP